MKSSIRDLLLVTVIVALVLGWAVDRSRLTRPIVYENAIILDGTVQQMKRGEYVLVECDGSGQMTIDFHPELKNVPDSQAPVPNPPKL